MDIDDVEKKQKTLAAFAKTDDPYELLKDTSLDEEALAYLAEQLAWGWKIDKAIVLLKHGVFASPVLRWAQMYAPEKVDEIHRAEYLGFRYVYEKNPEDWELKRQNWRNHLLSQKNNQNQCLYSSAEIEFVLNQYGFGDNVKELQ